MAENLETFKNTESETVKNLLSDRFIPDGEKAQLIALEHIIKRLGRIEDTLAKLILMVKP